MKKLGVSTALAVLTFSFLLWLSPLKAYAGSVTMTFTGVGPQDNNSGGVYTYPYDFTVTPTTGPSENLSLMCISFDKEIYLQNPYEYWTANVVTASSLGATDEEEAYLYSVAEANVSNNTVSGAANWADWALGDPSLILGNHIGGQELTDAVNDLTYVEGLTPTQLAEYANYLIYVPTTDGYSGDTDDKTPQTFVGAPAPTPEPSSLVLLGSGLLAAAGALYRRKKQLTA